MNDRRPTAEGGPPSSQLVRLLAAVLPLVAVYLVVLVSIDPWDALIGAAIALVLLWTFRRFLGTGSSATAGVMLRRSAAFVPFALVVVWDIVVGTWQVAVVVLGLRPLRRPGIVAVPIGERTRLGVAVSSLATTLSPGSLLVDVNWQRRVMLIHLLDASDPDATRDRMDRFYQRYQRHVFP